MCGKSTVNSFPDYSTSPGGIPQSYEGPPAEAAPAVTVKQLLTAARAIIAEPIHWIKGNYATRRYTDAAGRSLDRSVNCYCAVGALRHAADQLKIPEYKGVADAALECLAAASPLAARPDLGHEGKVTVYNDEAGTRHEDVLALFDKAVEGCAV